MLHLFVYSLSLLFLECLQDILDSSKVGDVYLFWLLLYPQHLVDTQQIIIEWMDKLPLSVSLHFYLYLSVYNSVCICLSPSIHPSVHPLTSPPSLLSFQWWCLVNTLTWLKSSSEELTPQNRSINIREFFYDFFRLLVLAEHVSLRLGKTIVNIKVVL